MSAGGWTFAFDSPAGAAAAMIARAARGAAPDEEGDLAASRGRVLAADVRADRDSPAFDYSAMDGYALRVEDVGGAAGEVSMPVLGEVRIGEAPRPLDAPAAVRIVTGAAIPAGADAVIKREDVVEQTDGPGAGASAIRIPAGLARRVKRSDHIRRRGENARAGEAVIDAGTVLSAPALATLAAAGCTRPRLRPRVRVAVITTGDELVAADQTPGPYQVRNSNGPGLHAMLVAHAWIDAAAPRHAGDDPGTLARVLREAIESADAVVLTGGASVGHRDPVRSAVEETGAEIVFHGLPQRPGKPMLGALVTTAGGARVPVLGLPGNPVSAMVTCTRIVLPVLGALAGIARWPTPPRVSLANPDGQRLDLWWHRLVRIDTGGEAELVDARGSGDVIAAGRADGFLEIPPSEAAAGGPYSFFAWAT